MGIIHIQNKKEKGFTMNHPKGVNEEAQNELAAMLISEGEDPENWRCRTCGALYDGGQRCTYCGDDNPLDDVELRD